METVTSLTQNGLQDFQQRQKQLLQAVKEAIDTIKQMGYDALRKFNSQLKSLGAACVTLMDNFRQRVLSELNRALNYIKNMTYKELALLGTTLTGIVIGGVFGIVIGGGLIAGAVGGVIGGCVLFGACLVGTKWRGYRLNTKRVIKTVGVVSVASAIGGVVCFAFGAPISGPILLGSIIGLALTGGSAALGYLADTCDKNKEQEERIDQLEKDKEEQKRRMDQFEHEREEIRNEREELRKDKEEQKRRMDQFEHEREEIRTLIDEMRRMMHVD